MQVEPVITALSEQVECYRRLVKLAELQHQHVQSGATQLLLEVLGRRQQELDRISALEQTVSPARRQWATLAGSMQEEVRRHAESLLGETRRLLELITASDRSDALVLQQQKLSLGQQMNQTAAARQVNRKYATAAYGTPRSRMDIHR